MSKIIISIKDGNLYSDFDLRFGRAAFFCMYDDETGEHTFDENPFKHQTENAGVDLCKYLISRGVSKVISGDFGNKTYAYLIKNNVQMIIPYQINKLTEVIKMLKTNNSNSD